jgi:hypothetical protein
MIGLVLKSRFSTETAADLVFDSLFIAAGIVALVAVAAALDFLRPPGPAKAAAAAPLAQAAPAPMVPAE